MRILSITAQKPDSTGSGVFLTELTKAFDTLGCDQAVVCGTVQNDVLPFLPNIATYPVYYQSEALPFPVCGMSDEMPYESTRYRDMTEDMTARFRNVFSQKITEAVETFRPDVILCHHLYFLASLTRELYPNIPLFGQCHGSDLRQLETNPWQREWIQNQIPKLDGIFALHEAQKSQICKIFKIPQDRVRVMGTGYNSSIFYHDEEILRDGQEIRYLFAGKLSEKKGVHSLIHCLSQLKNPENAHMYLAGGCGSEEELEKLRMMADQAPCPVTFLGKLDQKALAVQMNRCDVFVLPSFYEGLPLVLIEAMACGMKTISTDLPGIQPWLNQAIPNCGTIYVTPPHMLNTDEPIPAEIPAFETRLAKAMDFSATVPLPDANQVSHLSWTALCRKLLTIFEHQEVSQC